MRSGSYSLLMIAMLVAGSIIPDTELRAANDYELLEQRAWQAWQTGESDTAHSLYKQIPGYRGRLGEGNSLYRQAEFSAAIRQFSQAVLLAESDNERGRALYNLGNSYFRSGNYQDAITTYENALLYQPGHHASQRNLAFSQALQVKVDQELANAALRAERMGRGPRSGRAEQPIDINESGAISVDDSVAGEQELADLPALRNPPSQLTVPNNKPIG